MLKETGNLFIVSAPSGGGKTSLVKAMVATLDNIEISISHTTRSMRPCEVHAVDYFFINDQEFEAMIAEEAFLEYARVFDNYYGTSLQQIKDKLKAGNDVILDIDWQGAAQIKKRFPRAISVFIVPPSLTILKQRLQNRNQDEDDVIASRMKQARDELLHYQDFDYLIVNEAFEKAVLDLQAIVLANRLLLQRQMIRQKSLLSFLLSA